MNPSKPEAGAWPPANLMAVLLGIGAVLYTLLAAGCASYLLYSAYSIPGTATQSEFNKLAISALIAVIGTGLTGLTAIYAATRQSATAFSVEKMREDSEASLAEMKRDLDASLLRLKAASDEALERLRVALDTGQLAHRELWGTATNYFYTLRSIARSEWDDDKLKTAESAMITAARHVIHVEKEMRDHWFNFWQRAQDICRDARTEPDAGKRHDILKELIGRKIDRLDLRDMHSLLEGTAKRALKGLAVTQSTLQLSYSQSDVRE